MTSTDTLGRLHRVCTRRQSLTGWYSPPVEGCQAPLDGVVSIVSAPGNSPPAEGCQAPLDGVVSSYLHPAIPLLRRGVKLRLDGVVSSYLHPAIPLLWRGGKLCLTGWCPDVSATFQQFPSCGGVARGGIPLLRRGVKLRLTGWCVSAIPLLKTGWYSPPVEGCQAPLDGVVSCICTQQFPSCGWEMTSTDILLQSYRVCTRRRSLTGWVLVSAGNSPPMEGWQA